MAIPLRFSCARITSVSRATMAFTRETEVIRAQLKRNGIAIHQGIANYLSLARDNGVHTGGDILNRNAGTTSRSIAVQSVYGKAGKLNDGLTYRLAGDRTGMNAIVARETE